MKKFISLMLVIFILTGSLGALASCERKGYCEHVDADNDGICDKCSEAVNRHEHTDADEDGFCDTCSEYIDASGGTVVIDTQKTQLYVYNFDGGYGTTWLNAVKARFEELHKDDVWEEGKKGVQVVITAKKENASSISDKILSNREEVYFTEFANYYSMLSQGILGDITDAVVGDMSSYGDPAGTTIEGKLTAEQQDYYGINEDGDTRYYALPHYAGYVGTIYNVDLFEERGYYFKKDYDKNASIAKKFVTSPTDERSTGPDGKYGTSDDGLPATYEEYFVLCEYIKLNGQTPLVWTGHDYISYLLQFTDCLQVDFEGKEQSMLNYNLGLAAGANSATSLGTIVNGEFVKDASATVISKNNFTNIFRQEGRYRALSFLEDLIKNTRYQHESVFNSAFTHMNAQEKYLMSGQDGVTDQIAMIIEGIWWESEATGYFNKMVDSLGDEYSKMNRRFAFMPYPKATEEQVGQDTTMFDHIYSMCFMKANVADWKRPLAIDFIKFVNSQQSLVEFTQITNTPKALQYSMSDAELAKMSYFGRSVMELQQRSDVVYPFHNNPTYVNYQSNFNSTNMYGTDISGTKYTSAPLTFHENASVTAESYFAGMKAYYDAAWKNMLSE